MYSNSLDKYLSLFLHNNSLYIIHTGKTWLTEKQEVIPQLIQKHLERKITIGLCPVREDNTLKWVAFDFDAHNDEPIEEIQENVKKTKENLKKVNIDSHIEKSGRGYHLWIFLEEPILRERIEKFLKRFAYHSAEIYAGKQKIRIPLGSYQKDKSIFCGFLDDNFNLVGNQEEYLLDIKPTSLETIKQAKKMIRENNPLKIKLISQNKKRKIVTEQKWVNYNKEWKPKPTIPKIEINKVIYSTKNKQHRFILQLLLEMNLSPRELLRIKVQDVSINEQILRIQRYKPIQRKMLLISGHLIETFKEHLKDKQFTDTLLQTNRGKRYSCRTIQKIKQNAFKKANLAPESDEN